MNRFGIIYKITNLVNGKLYAGQTVRSLGDRWADHKRDSLNGVDYPLHFAIRKYGVDNFIIEELDFASSIEELNEKEIFWIKELNSLCKNGNGYNVLTGGLGLKDINSEPTINITTGMEFISGKEMAKYYGLSNDFVYKVLMGHKRLKNGNVFRYKDLEKQRRADIRSSFVPLHKALPKKIICLDTKELFDSAKSASVKLGITRTSITNNLSGRSRHAGGFRFAYDKLQLLNGEI
jgi:group I intron endonuclease